MTAFGQSAREWSPWAGSDRAAYFFEVRSRAGMLKFQVSIPANSVNVYESAWEHHAEKQSGTTVRPSLGGTWFFIG